MWRVRSASVAIDEELSHHTPQGVAWWKNWDDKGNDLLLITTYGKGKAHIVGLDPKTNDKTVGTVDIKPKDDKEQQTHAGAIALYDREQEDGKNEGWVFIDGPKVKPVPVDRVWHTIRKYRLSDLRKAMTKKNGFVESVGEKKVYGASFMTIDGRHLYAGKWNPKRRDWMYSYTIHDDGSLSGDTKEDKKRLRWEVPRNTQGVAVADGRFLFSSSGGRKWRSNLYVTDKGET